MALLFLKQKLFPSKDTSSVSCANGNNKPLLQDDYHDHDLEAQLPRSYHTFQHNPPQTDRDDDDGEERNSVSTNSSSRTRIDPRIISDSILGLSDGLTVPFALSAGLSALGDTKVVVLGGLAELAAGAISMGLGGYVGAKSEIESYDTTVQETNELISSSHTQTDAIVHGIFSQYGISQSAISQINSSLNSSRERLLDFLIAFHHKETKPDCNQAWTSALTLAIGYFIGGFIPLIPYFLVNQVIVALYWSIGVMGVTLFAFGYIKTGFVRGWTGKQHIIEAVIGGVQMCVVGGVAAGAAIGLVRLIDTGGG